MFYQFENDRKYDRASDYLEGFNGVIQITKKSIQKQKGIEICSF